MPRLRRAVPVILLCLAMPVSAGAATPGGAFSNSIAPNRFGDVFRNGADSPDPWMQYFRGRYYLTYSAHDDLGFSGDTQIEMRSASQIGGLASARPVQVWPPPGKANPPERCCQLWAPEFHRLRGPNGRRWYLYYSATQGNDTNTHATYVAESAGSTPLGPYRFKGKLELGRWAIDATVVSLRSGLYVFYAGRRAQLDTAQQMYAARLSNPWTVTGPSPELFEATLPWEKTLNSIVEGPEFLVRGNKLHLIYSASWCLGDNYKLGRATVRADSDPLDPATWARAKAPEPVLQTSVRNGVFGPGHNGFFKSPDGREDWIVYHATDKPGVGCFTGGVRLARAERIRWTRNGTPMFGEPAPLTRDLRPPSGDGTLSRQIEDLTAVAGPVGARQPVTASDLVGRQGVELRASAPGAYATYDLRVRQGGRYRLLVRVRAQPAGGRLRAILRGGRRGAARDSYARALRYPELELGTFRLRRGANRVRLQITGKNPSSSGYSVVLDQVRLLRRDR